jgi:type 1 glutamine amidotransferase
MYPSLLAKGKLVKTKLALSILAGVIFSASAAFAADPEFGLGPMAGKMKNVSADEQSKIEKAIPTEALAKPKKERKLIVFVHVPGREFYHDSIPLAAMALQKMGEKTGAFTATITDDEKIFSAANLAKFDGIFMVSTTGHHPLPESFDDKAVQARKDFSEYIKSGKGGLMGTHAGGDANHQWAEYQDMIGGEFAGHPYGKVAIKNEDPDNPINAVFGGKGFVISDEIYTFKPLTDKRQEGYSREKNHVLLSIDLEKSKLGDTTRKDGDYALAWTKKYGEGRVFYCSIGHQKEDWYNPVLLKHYLAGIQYALGDIETDATPSAKLPKDRKIGEAPAIDDKSASINVRDLEARAKAQPK